MVIEGDGAADGEPRMAFVDYEDQAVFVIVWGCLCTMLVWNEKRKLYRNLADFV